MIPLPSSFKLYGMIAIAVSLLGLSWTSLHLYKRLNQERVKCELVRQGDAGAVSKATHDAKVRALESEVAATERERDAAKLAQANADKQRATSDRVARTYRKELQDALIVHPDLNRPLGSDVLDRLCRAQADYDSSPREDCRH